MIDFDDDIGMPDMSYGWAKLTCEYLARLAYEKHGLKSVCYRPFSGYGEDQDDAYPFPSICKRALANAGADVLTVWGSGHADARLHPHRRLRARRYRDHGPDRRRRRGESSTGIFTSFIEFARMAAELCGYRPEVRGMSDKPAGVHARGGDTQKQKALGFTHSIDFSTGIRRALDYYCR